MAKKFTAVANADYYRAIVELRRSGAAGTHQDKRKRRARTRKAQVVRAIKDFLR